MDNKTIKIALKDELNHYWILKEEDGWRFVPYGGILMEYYNVLKDCFNFQEQFYYDDDVDYEIFKRNAKKIIHDFLQYNKEEDIKGYLIRKRKYDYLCSGFQAITDMLTCKAKNKREVYEKYKYFFSQIIRRSNERISKDTFKVIGREIVGDSITDVIVCESYCDLICLDLQYYVVNKDLICVKECVDCNKFFFVTNKKQERCSDCKEEFDRIKKNYKDHGKNPKIYYHGLINNRLTVRKTSDYEKFEDDYKRINEEKSEQDVMEWLIETEIQTRIYDKDKVIDSNVISSVKRKYPSINLYKYYPEYFDLMKTRF